MQAVLQVVVVHPPRCAPSLPGQVSEAALDVAGREVEEGPIGRLVLRRRGGGRRVAVALHEVEQPDDVAIDEVGPQRPRIVGVAEDEIEVGNAGQHHALVEHGLRQLDLDAVEAELQTAEREQLKPGRRDDDVGLEHLARREFDAVLAERGDAVGDDLGLA